MLPSWIKSRNDWPRLVYFLATDTTRRRLASGHVRLGLQPAIGGGLQFLEHLVKFLARHPHEQFQCLDFSLLGSSAAAGLGGGSLRFEFLNVPQAGLEFSWMLPATTIISSTTFCL